MDSSRKPNDAGHMELIMKMSLFQSPTAVVTVSPVGYGAAAAVALLAVGAESILVQVSCNIHADSDQ